MKINNVCLCVCVLLERGDASLCLLKRDFLMFAKHPQHRMQ